MGTSPASPREGERRHVTVMFADVSGFTAMARQMDPEEVTDRMNACFGILEKAIIECGGHVDKYIGDCVMALFGAPRALEDAPRQAVNAAISILERVSAFAGTRGMPGRVDVHVGINTGLVVYSDVGGDETRDTTAMGDTVNVAARLRDAAGAQQIFVGSQTHRETARDFRYRRVPGLRLKGVEGLYDGWEVLSRRPALHRSSPAADADTGPGPMIGREAAMEQVEEALGRLRSGQGGVLVVSGEAGIGKTRLLAEMRGSPRADGVQFVEGRALRIGGSLGLYPFVDMLRSWAGLDGDDGATDPRFRMVLALESVIGERTPEVYPFVATMAGLPLSPEDQRRIEGIDTEGMQWLITRGLQEVLEGLARAAPLVVVLEDLHWADQSTIDLLLRMLVLARRERVLFVLALRPDFEATSRPLVRAVAERYGDVVAEVALRPLDPKAAGALLRDRIRFDDRPDQTRRAILDRSEGNPFFIEEMIRSLIDVGAIQSGADGLRVTEHMSAVHVPGSVQELVMDRVDRLPKEVRDVLQAASVVGRAFPVPLLEAVVPDPAVLADALDELVHRGLLEPLPPGRDADYAFKHALAHDTVYEAILKRRRHEVHGRVGESIERLYADRLHDFHGQLAWHFTNAEQWEKASHYLLKAGDEAARSTASGEALGYFAEAARIFDRLHAGNADPAARAEIEKKIGLACLNKGDLPAAMEHIDRALVLLGLPVPTTAASMLWRVTTDIAAILAHLYLRGPGGSRPRPPDGVVATTQLLFQKGKAQATTAPQGYVMSMLPAIRAVGAWDFRGVEDACGVYSAGAALFAWSGLSFRIARRLAAAGAALVSTVPDAVIHETMKYVVAFLEGDWGDDRTLPEQLVADGLRYGAFWEVDTYLGMNCERLIRQGRFDEASRVIERLAELGDQYGYEFSRTTENAMRAVLLVEARCLDEAAEAADRYYEVCEEEALNLLALATRARVELLADRAEAALATLARAEELAARIGRQAAAFHLAPLRVARFHHDLMLLQAAVAGGHRGAASAARRRAEASRRAALASVTGIARDRPECYRLCARHDWILGRGRAAAEWWERALREAARLGARPESARAWREAGEALSGANDGGLRVDGLGGGELLARAATLEAELAAALAPPAAAASAGLLRA